MLSLLNQRLKERLLREPNLTLQKAIGTCHAAETDQAQQAMGTANQLT